jgi:uncharacterized membrane protein YraQ (UPF0718 family)
MILEILKISIIEFLKVLPILVIAIVISQIVKVYLENKKIHENFKANKKNIVKASLIGISTPGPLLAYLPILKTLKEQKIPVSILVGFITGQTLIGPMRIFLEINYFGVEFFIYRLIISFFIAIIIALGFMALEKYIKF